MMDEPMMMVSAVVHGEPSVGIFSQDFHFDFPLCMLDDDDDSIREEIRDRFDYLIRLLVDEIPHVWFSDECPDCCGRLGEDGFCHSSHCMDQL